MPKISSSVHTRLENALGLRKEVLETALKATELLQKFKQYKKDNREKSQQITKFKKEISGLKDAIHELEFKDLPKNIIKEQKPEAKPLKEAAQEIKKQIEEPIVKSELQQQVEDLRTRIDSIKI